MGRDKDKGFHSKAQNASKSNIIHKVNPQPKKSAIIAKNVNKPHQTAKPHRESSQATALKPSSPSSSKLSELQLKFSKKLEGGRFRYINEQLYTRSGIESFESFQSEPELFDVYHRGYREQVESWPENPLHRIIHWIRTQHPKAVIADMGCGEANLAESIQNKVYSFDLVSRKPIVTACDIAHTPLSDHSIDIAVFCLSLMGSNITDFIREAYRILKPSGILKIIEVRSRFESDSGGVKKFMKVLKKGGFSIINKGLESNTMFFEVECKKNNEVDPKFDESYSAKACLYKRR
jgi:ribosomal RNA-processing protein 8